MIRRERVTYAVEKSGGYGLDHMTKVTITSNAQILIGYHLIDATRRTQHHFCRILAKNTEPRSNHEGNEANPYFQNYCPVIFKSFRVMKDKASLRNSSRLKKSKETRQFNATCHLKAKNTPGGKPQTQTFMYSLFNILLHIFTQIRSRDFQRHTLKFPNKCILF